MQHDAPVSTVDSKTDQKFGHWWQINQRHQIYCKLVAEAIFNSSVPSSPRHCFEHQCKSHTWHLCDGVSRSNCRYPWLVAHLSGFSHRVVKIILMDKTEHLLCCFTRQNIFLAMTESDISLYSWEESNNLRKLSLPSLVISLGSKQLFTPGLCLGQSLIFIQQPLPDFLTHGKVEIVFVDTNTRTFQMSRTRSASFWVTVANLASSWHPSKTTPYKTYWSLISRCQRCMEAESFLRRWQRHLTGDIHQLTIVDSLPILTLCCADLSWIVVSFSLDGLWFSLWKQEIKTELAFLRLITLM